MCQAEGDTGNCQLPVNSFALIESDWVFNLGILSLMRSILKIKQSSFPQCFFREVSHPIVKIAKNRIQRIHRIHNLHYLDFLLFVSKVQIIELRVSFSSLHLLYLSYTVIYHEGWKIFFCNFTIPFFNFFRTQMKSLKALVFNDIHTVSIKSNILHLVCTSWNFALFIFSGNRWSTSKHPCWSE